MGNYKDNIIATRVGSLGSSDAKMVAQVGRSGMLSNTAKERLAVLTGQREQRDFSNAATRNGDYIEQEIYRSIREHYWQAVSNPCFASNNLHTDYFNVIDHIDIEVAADEDLIWYEVKASKYSTQQVKAEYEDQLKWHYLLLQEKAALLRLKPQLVLVHYLVEDYEAAYDPERVSFVPVSFGEGYKDEIVKGLEILTKTLAEGFTWSQPEELEASDLPAEVQSKVDYVAAMLRDIAAKQAEVDAFKGGLLELCQKYNVKKITTDGWTATVKDGYVTSRLNSNKLKSDLPDIYEKYVSQSQVKPSILIKLN